jgi:hypothetical protein
MLLSSIIPENNNSENAWLEYCQALLCANEFIYVD